MKKLLKGIVCAILIVMIIGIGSSTVRTITKNQKRSGSSAGGTSGSDSSGIDSGGTSEELPAGMYRISYKVAGSGEDLAESFSWLMKSDGSYPELYESAAGVQIGDLAGGEASVSEGVEPGENELPLASFITPVYDPEDREHWAWFIGWYLDIDCAEEFNGEIAAGTEGDVTLYAKIGEDRESDWTKFY